MILKNVFINKFRGFSDVNLPLGENITVIAGQNGTQKTTILGLITQPFSITDKENRVGTEIIIFSDEIKFKESIGYLNSPVLL